ncbi:MAG: hypothetical protein RBR50_01085 [Candidatus Izemoplasmatales bacterium]|nr:hypothetical protein [Candidatus Izemoplasmatales bacterium]
MSAKKTQALKIIREHIRDLRGVKAVLLDHNLCNSATEVGNAITELKGALAILEYVDTENTEDCKFFCRNCDCSLGGYCIGIDCGKFEKVVR